MQEHEYYLLKALFSQEDQRLLTISGNKRIWVKSERTVKYPKVEECLGSVPVIYHFPLVGGKHRATGTWHKTVCHPCLVLWDVGRFIREIFFS